MNAPTLPANISIATAKLPETYERAKQALTACNNIDECKDWADKMEALASYAKQADDETLFKYATRIRARAVKRVGELLLQVPAAKNQHDANTRRGTAYVAAVTGSTESRSGAARVAGLSERQKVTALRVARLDGETFETELEGETPPTITKLAAMGTQSRTPPPPEGFAKATHLLGTVRRFAEFCRANDALFVAGGVLPKEAAEVRQQVGVIDGWLDRFIVNLKG